MVAPSNSISQRSGGPLQRATESAAAAMRTQGVALALPGNRLVGVLHGAYTFDETSFVKSGMLVILVAPDEGSDDHLHGEELLGQLQPTLHFQSLGFVLPDRQKRGGKSTIESWADDVAEILKFLHDTQQQMEVRGIVAHGKAAEACLLHANRTAMIAAAEAEAEANPKPVEEEKEVKRCAGKCGCVVTWHSTHCCRMCAAQPGEHGPLCERVLAEPPPKRYDVRQLCLLGCSHEGPDGAPFDATDAFEHSWRMLSIHGTEDVIADLLSAQVFHSQHRGCGAKRTNEDHHRLRLVPKATHSFNKHLSAVGGLINDWFEGARRLGSNDLGASLGAAAGGEDSGGPRLLRGESGSDESPSHVNLSGTRANARMLGNGVLWLAEELRNDTTVRSLDLSSNNIRHAAANALASALEVNTTLGSLELSHNNLLGNGAQTLAASLQNSKSLTRLGLKSNGIGATGAAALAVALASNRCSLTSLNLRGMV